MKRLIARGFGAVAVVTAVVAGAPAHAAGTVQVKFVEPDKFADVRGMHQRVDEGLLKMLETHFQAAASKYVPDGQTLSIDVLDVDLAGEFRPRFSASPDVRVLGLGADSPHIKLRYALSSPIGAAPSTEPKPAEVQLSDLGYLYRGVGGYSSSESLRFEKRMIDEWVKTTFASK